MKARSNMEAHTNHTGWRNPQPIKLFSLRGEASSSTGCSQRLCRLHPWSFSRHDWIKPWATCEQEAALAIFWGPFQPGLSHKPLWYMPQHVMQLDLDVILASGRYYYGDKHRLVKTDSMNKTLGFVIFKSSNLAQNILYYWEKVTQIILKRPSARYCCSPIWFPKQDAWKAIYVWNTLSSSNFCLTPK